jgi:hypothetical protein
MARRRISPILDVFHPNSPAAYQYILRMYIIHDAKCSILERVVNVHSNGGYSIWPGIDFDIASEECKAILGTVHGAGVTWMLIQRKLEFSGKRIKWVTLSWAEYEGDK